MHKCSPSWMVSASFPGSVLSLDLGSGLSLALFALSRLPPSCLPAASQHPGSSPQTCSLAAAGPSSDPLATPPSATRQAQWHPPPLHLPHSPPFQACPSQGPLQSPPATSTWSALRISAPGLCLCQQSQLPVASLTPPPPQ